MSALGLMLSVDTGAAQEPGNPGADAGARELLAYLDALGGVQILSGQGSMFWDNEFAPHFPSVRERYVYERTGAYPALYSSDFGDFHDADPARRPEVLAMRRGVVDAALEHARRGSIIQLHYHMVEPTEPDGSGLNHFGDRPYPAAYIDRMLEPGTALNREYLRRLDEIAGYLGELRDAGVAVLWRPFHEMNGPWFWWGQKGERFVRLWRHMWERYTEVHGLDNLLWVFSVNYWEPGAAAEWRPETYYPGDGFVDVLGVDVYLQYGHDYGRHLHDTLLDLGGGRPIAITENGRMPDVAALRRDGLRWVYWSTWFGFESASSDQLYRDNYIDRADSVVTQAETFAEVPERAPGPPEQPGEPEEPEPPPPAIVLDAVSGDGEARLSWNALPGVDWYNVWIGSSSSDIDWLEGTGSTSFTARQLENGSRYVFAVTPYVNDRDGGFSNVVEVRPTAGRSEPPDGSDLVLRVEPGDRQARLSWNALPGVDWYNVWIGSSSSDIDWLEGTGSTSFIARQLENGSRYVFAVTPYVGDQDGAFSNIVEVTPARSPAPTLAGRVEGEAVRLSWPAVDGVGWYNVWRGDSDASIDWLRGTGETVFIDADVEAGNRYRYRVTSYVDGVDSAFSNTVTVNP